MHFSVYSKLIYIKQSTFSVNYQNEKPKCNKGNLLLPLTHTVNAIELQSNKKLAISPPPFLHQPPPPLFRVIPISTKIFGTPPPQVTQFLEGPTPTPFPTPLIKGGRFQLCRLCAIMIFVSFLSHIVMHFS